MVGGARMTGRILETEADLAAGAAWLAAREPCLASVLARVGPLPLRRRADGFGALLEAIVSQQVSLASAAAVLGRLRAAGLDAAQALAGAEDEVLRGCGLSRQKIFYIKGLAAAGIDYAGLHVLPDDAVVARLMALPGIGRWSAEIYAMFALGRADVLAAGDLALQEGARMLFGLPARPAPAALATMAEAWSPWRAVAARLLWAYYGAARGREGVGA